MRRRPRVAGSAIRDAKVLRSLFRTATLMATAALTVLAVADEGSAVRTA